MAKTLIRWTSAMGSSCLALSLTLASAGVMVPVPGDPVRIDSGQLAGTLLPDGVKAYFGVPFAAPPVRENRWRAPQPVKPWRGIYTADAKPPECIERLRSSNINHYFGEEATSEDCLYLNIWAPMSAHRGDKRPVVVWIYGGGFNIGSASSPIYGGAALARKGVVYVAANYRLGVFGFLAHPALTAQSPRHASGNWGFLDQVAALRWIQRNIAAFGGDPSNVTLIGQSAGSMSINDLQASPLGHGLFERVLGMSGSTVVPTLQPLPLSAAEAQGLALQRAMQVSSLADMRALSADRVMEIAQQARVRAAPDIDGDFLPDTPERLFAQDRQSDVPVLVGSTANDIGTDIALRQARTVADYRQMAMQAFGTSAGQFLQLWPASNDAQVRREAEEVGRDSGFGSAAYRWATLQATTGRQPAYLYLFTRVQPFAPGVQFADFDPTTAGAYHMGDVPYWLGTYNEFNLFRTTRDWTDLDRNLSTMLQDVIVAYARTGDPTTQHVRFVRFNPADPERTDIGDRINLQKMNAPGMDFLIAHPLAPRRRQAPEDRRPRPAY